MIVSYPRLWKYLVGLTFLTAIIGVLIPHGTWVSIVSIGLILFLGIPHGAADHKLFQALFLQHYDWKKLFTFYSFYLCSMAVVVLLWWVFPIIALVLFLALSAYHFGQANFHYLNQANWSNKLLFLGWGTWVIASPVVLQYSEAQLILEALLQQPMPSFSNSGRMLAVLFGLAITGLLLLRLLPRSLFYKELLNLLCLSCLFWACPLLLGFGLYFAAWHALPSAIDQIRFFKIKDTSFSAKQYLVFILPYSLLAILSIILGTLLLNPQAFGEFWRIIFTAIAALTLPHMLLLDTVYQRLEAKISN